MTAVNPVRCRMVMNEWELELWEHYTVYAVTGYGRALVFCWNRENAEEILEKLKESTLPLLEEFPELFQLNEYDDLLASLRIIPMQGPALGELFGVHGRTVP